MSALSGKKVLFGITGSIAAYKSVQILRDLTLAGADVKVVLTPSAVRFVPPLTLQVFSGHPVSSDPFEPRDEVLHLALAEEAELVLVAPATANFIAKAAIGLADDLLSTLLLGLSAPLLFAPAMDGGMWEHPAVQRNVSTLIQRGVRFVGPVSGPLASGKSGPGRMSEPSAVVEAVISLLSPVSEDLRGEVIVVTAGPTQEPIDPVRYLTNRSSGKMGYAIAERAQRRGGKVILISGPTHLAPPGGVDFYSVRTAHEMKEAVLKRIIGATTLIMAAAVSDYRPKAPADRKIKKGRSGVMLDLTVTEDILKEARQQNKNLFMVGFAAETERLVENARKKLVEKKLDLVVANEVGDKRIGFESDENEVTILGKRGVDLKVGRSPKTIVADRILDLICRLKQE
ncbi:MAG TPA: bifunctional phosphopantothenoylcysteine decarboxylase/phosphopantothenate--cysteine ligase CoaBC [Nitrospiria bacterium]|nr:bifunctional phosphopantothenoylcysteine decarboxylase/phosphopantothenate--cysteine ligase CoaBC [Nitrospiria bacterium]